MTGTELMTAKIMAYDDSYSNPYRMSDFNKYERTYEICNEHTICMFSGNVIKINSYSLKEPFIVSNHDKEFLRTLEQMRLEDSVVYEQEDSSGDGMDMAALSEDEAAAKLLTDDTYSYEEPSDKTSESSEAILNDSEKS